MKHLCPCSVGVLLGLALLCGSISFVTADPPAAPVPGTLLLVAGTGTKGSQGDGGLATEARLNGPMGLAFDPAGNLCIGEIVSGRVRQVSPAGIISTRVRFTDVMFLEFDGAGNLFVDGWFASRVWKVTPEGVKTPPHVSHR